MESSSSELGLIAGSTQMPLVVAAEARRAGRRVIAAAIRGITESAIEGVVDETTWLDWSNLQGFLELLDSWRERGVTEAIMAGKVEQQRMYERDDSGAMERVLEGLPSGHTDQLLGAVANVLEGAGITLLASTHYLQAFLARAGNVCGRAPSAAEQEDIEHGWSVAKHVAALDIGQTVVVKEKAVVAVEGMEGTDACIRRAGELAGPGTTVVKVAKPQQDLRFDVPVIGCGTLEVMAASGCVALAIEADMTVVFDRDELDAVARRHDLAVWARHAD